jgi:uncharacterized protein (DUF302 family)
MRYIEMKKLAGHFQLLILLLMCANWVSASEDPIVTRKVEGTFQDVSSSVRTAILGKGINIANVLPASQMLHRTGADFGYENHVYGAAETYEFCSARISHKLSRAHPDNIVLCPFTISVYTIKSEPGLVRLSYRIPTGRPGSEEVVKEVVELIESIVDEASW